MPRLRVVNPKTSQTTSETIRVSAESAARSLGVDVDWPRHALAQARASTSKRNLYRPVLATNTADLPPGLARIYASGA